MEQVYASLTARATQLYSTTHHPSTTSTTQPPQSKRTIIALAGPPGSGKSTIAAEVVRRLNLASSEGVPYAVVLPMDGFHYPKHILDTFPNRAEAYARRGAAWTFDAAGVVDLVQRLAAVPGEEPILAPTFSHAAQDPVADAIAINPAMQLIILEGNWLLLDEEPWRQIGTYVDETWFVDVDPVLARERIVKRHLAAGIERTVGMARKRAEQNDLVNGELVRSRLGRVDVRVVSVEDVREEVKEVVPVPVPVPVPVVVNRVEGGEGAVVVMGGS